jgi:signal transduction histidine kinase
MPTDDPALAEMVARTLRHEVGDLLQSVYATTALLQALLPREQERERCLAVELRQRGEVCRQELDAVYDLICPLRLDRGPVDLAGLLRGLTAAAALRTPGPIDAAIEAPLEVVADARRLQLVGELLLSAACQAAQGRVTVRARAEDGRAEWSVADDGPAASADQLIWMDRPFAHTREARAGLGLALARRVLEAHGGGAEVDSPPDGGRRVRLWLPHDGGR